MKYIKILFSVFLSTLICSFKASAALPLPMVNIDNSFLNAMTETRAFLLRGDGILLIFFILWIAYIVFCFPKDTPKKL